MKKTKKMLALALALMMAFTTLAMPAMAAEDEGIMPLYLVLRCPVCGQEGRADREDFSHSYIVNGCAEKPGSHSHTNTLTVYTYAECGHHEYHTITECK